MSDNPIMSKDEVIQKQIDEIMDNFPFEKVHAQMVSEDWKWGDGMGGMQIPEIPELRKSAREILRTSANTGYCSSGGFTARCDQGTDDDGPWLRLTLSFGHEWGCEGETYV